MSTVERLTEAVALTGLSAYGVRFSDLVVRYGEVVVLAGPNGSGKSTISRVIVGELAVAGTARVVGLDPVDEAADLKGRINLQHLFARQLSILGCYMGRFAELRAAAPLFFEGKLGPVIDEVFPLARAADAQRRLEDKSQFGKTVLLIE